VAPADDGSTTPTSGTPVDLDAAGTPGIDKPELAAAEDVGAVPADVAEVEDPADTIARTEEPVTAIGADAAVSEPRGDVASVVPPAQLTTAEPAAEALARQAESVTSTEFTSAASDAGLTASVSRWKATRRGPASTQAEPEDESVATPEADDAPRSRKQSVAAAPTADLPEGLSARGRKMYAVMNGGVDSTAVKDLDTDPKQSSKIVARLLVALVIGGLLLFSSLHYTEISAWVSGHVHLPSFGDSKDNPEKDVKNPEKTKAGKSGDDKPGAKQPENSSTGNPGR
jgi:hypothetical protein